MKQEPFLILHVEDELAHAEMVRRALVSFPCQIQHVADGQQPNPVSTKPGEGQTDEQTEEKPPHPNPLPRKPTQGGEGVNMAHQKGPLWTEAIQTTGADI